MSIHKLFKYQYFGLAFLADIYKQIQTEQQAISYFFRLIGLRFHGSSKDWHDLEQNDLIDLYFWMDLVLLKIERGIEKKQEPGSSFLSLELAL